MHSGKGGAAWLQSQLRSYCVITGKSHLLCKIRSWPVLCRIPSSSVVLTQWLLHHLLWHTRIMTTLQQDAREAYILICNAIGKGNKEQKEYMQVCINGKTFNLTIIYSTNIYLLSISSK